MTINVSAFYIYRNEITVSGLLWQDVDFKKRIIHVRHTLAPCDGGWRNDTPKTNSMESQILKTILEHAALSMTMDLYSHIFPGTKAEAMEKAAGAF